MPDILPDANAVAPIDLAEAQARLSETGFSPTTDDSVRNAHAIMSGLHANRDFIADAVLMQLHARATDPSVQARYNGQTIELGADPAAGYILRANIWPSADDPLMQRPGAGVFQYGFAHDHNFDFLTVGYHGPGYHSEFFAYDYEGIVGYAGEPVIVSPLPSVTLSEGAMLLYRAQQDVHRQMPPESLSLSLNIVHVHPRQNWFDQYSFDVEGGTIDQVLSHSPIEALLSIAPYLGGERAQDVAHHLSRYHPSEAIRLTAVQSLANGHVAMGGDESQFWTDQLNRSDSKKVSAIANKQLADLSATIL